MTAIRNATHALMFSAVVGAGTILASAAAEENSAAPANLTEQIQQLKKEVIALNRDLFVLEEQLLYPSSTQLAVYLAMDVGDYFKLDAVELKIDGTTATHYLYTEQQLKALQKGAVQRLHLTNLTQGEHEITALFIGTGPNGRDYKRGTTAKIVKDKDAKAVQLNIVASASKEQPEFQVTEL